MRLIVSPRASRMTMDAMMDSGIEMAMIAARRKAPDGPVANRLRSTHD
jgi:hypothetical protein